MKTADIRNAFLGYFAKQQHQLLPSSSLVPNNDPTLLFTNAGMVQFKDVFLGQDKRPYSRATTAQRCVRAGGKHNDLDNVGYTARHHTFFEMLGNFSFGDYFKRDAIQFAWGFLTNVLSLPKERLWVTVFENDDEAANIWLNEMGVDKSRFSRCGEKDNFWSMGDTGPCGPCTEIFYDHGPDIPGGPPGSPEADGDRYIEIWNLVFMQFNRASDGTMTPLPKPSVDTGMGLERIAAVIQGVHNNYDIDLFRHIKASLFRLAPNAKQDSPSFNVVADHIRACAFLIADGVVPSNEGRGYVLRRILRRAVRHGHKLGMQSPFLAVPFQALCEVMSQAYPELLAQKERIEATLAREEQQFAQTLEQGLQILDNALQSLTGKLIPGDVAFKLYDTYGFPLDLTQDIARERNLAVDNAGFEAAMAEQRAKSQTHSSFKMDDLQNIQSDTPSDFKGYDVDVLEATLNAIWVEGKAVANLAEGDKAYCILDRTPFYAESGGQVADTGFIQSETGLFAVEDTQKAGQAIVHRGRVVEGRFSAGQRVWARIDTARRQGLRQHHSATHLLHSALREILGSSVQQMGSLVAHDSARFDFSFDRALSAEELMRIEILINQKIQENMAIVTECMDKDSAVKAGAMALFGEKYDSVVRVLRMGDFSVELCGGTHASATGDIGLVIINAEYGIASGVRRIEFVAGHAALAFVQAERSQLREAAARLKATPTTVVEKIGQIQQQMREQQQEVQKLKQQLANQSTGDIAASLKDVQGVPLLVQRIQNADMAMLRTTLDSIKAKLPPAVVVLYSHDTDKIQALAVVHPSLSARVVPAPVLIQHLCGKGGGRPDMAQGGANLPPDLEQRLATLEKQVLLAQA